MNDATAAEVVEQLGQVLDEIERGAIEASPEQRAYLAGAAAAVVERSA